jgi:hypothetical protein
MRIRSLEDGDRAALLSFLAEGFPSTPHEKWDLLLRAFWDENPAMERHMARGWVLVEDEKTIRGFIGSVPFRYRVAGAAGLAASAVGWYVERPFRGTLSLDLVKAFQAQPGIHLFLSTTPNDLAVNIFTRLGFSPVPVPYGRTEHWLIVNWQETVDLVTGNIIPSVPPGLTRLIAKPAAPLGRLLTHSFGGSKWKDVSLAPDFDFTECRTCDDSFTRLWERTRGRFSTTLNRDAATLNWLFFSRVIAHQRIVFRCTRPGSPELVGYFAYDLRQAPGHKARFLQLKDIFVPGLDRGFLIAFLAFSGRLAKERGAAVVHIWPQDRTMAELLDEELRIKRKLDWPYLAKRNIQRGVSGARPPTGEHVPSPIEPDRGFS